MKLLIGARKSALSRIQAFEVGRALRDRNPNLSIEYKFREALGDVQLNQRLSSFGDRGVFTEDFTKSLVTGEIDIAVHSWKDLPTAERPETVVAATLPRADCHDVLLLVKDRVEGGAAPLKLKVLSSSPRREYNLGDFLTWAFPIKVLSSEFEPVRGNVETRIRKLLDGEAHGLVVAKAALDRLLSVSESEFAESRAFIAAALKRCILIVLPLTICPAAPAQGALAIEILRTRADLAELLRSVNHLPTFDAVSKERAVLSGYGGGCHQKIGVTVLKRSYGEVTFLRGLTDQGEVLQSSRITSKSVVLPRAESPLAIWPRGDGAELFDREEVPISDVTSKLRSHGLWISKAEALPAGLKVPSECPVWVAGLSTWRKVAKCGVWVTGCAEGLGESESPCLEMVMPELKGWVKLTHLDGVSSDQGETISTYKLVPRQEPVSFAACTHFFWRSGSAFRSAVQRCPEIRNGFHGCGPGHTYHVVQEIVGSPERVGVYLSYEEFLEEVRP